MLISRDGFDPIATVVDWLDACRSRNLDALLELYAEGATIECECECPGVWRGRRELADYWRPRLAAFSPSAFGIDEISIDSGGVALEYGSHEGKPVRIFFRFGAEGKIAWTACGPFNHISGGAPITRC
jgi:hypothetical protein